MERDKEQGNESYAGARFAHQLGYKKGAQDAVESYKQALKKEIAQEHDNANKLFDSDEFIEGYKHAMFNIGLLIDSVK
jgi:hypothetical protein